MANELSNLHPVPGERKTRMRVGRGLEVLVAELNAAISAQQHRLIRSKSRANLQHAFDGAPALQRDRAATDKIAEGRLGVSLRMHGDDSVPVGMETQGESAVRVRDHHF